MVVWIVDSLDSVSSLDTARHMPTDVLEMKDRKWRGGTINYNCILYVFLKTIVELKFSKVYNGYKAMLCTIAKEGLPEYINCEI